MLPKSLPLHRLDQELTEAEAGYVKNVEALQSTAQVIETIGQTLLHMQTHSPQLHRNIDKVVSALG